jgi:hypothetical protein
VTELLLPVVCPWAEDYAKICAFLSETLEKDSFWEGYLAHATWRAKHGRPTMLWGRPIIEARRGIAVPIAT